MRLGIVDCDTSHVVAFTRLLQGKDPSGEQRIDDARIVTAFPGTSRIKDAEVVEGYVRALREEYGVEIVDHMADLVGKVDAVLVESNEGALHAPHAIPFLEQGIPVFVDKPFAPSVDDARRMIDAARRGGTFVWSASSLRFVPEVEDIQRRGDQLGAVVGVDAFSPATLHPRNPGLTHYGVHGVEILYALMGTGCTTVRCIREEGAEIVIGQWHDGRLGTMRGMRQGPHDYGFTAFCERGIVPVRVDASVIYRELLTRITRAFRDGRAPLSPDELVEPIAFMEAAMRSSEADGAEIALG